MKNWRDQVKSVSGSLTMMDIVGDFWLVVAFSDVA